MLTEKKRRRSRRQGHSECKTKGRRSCRADRSPNWETRGARSSPGPSPRWASRSSFWKQRHRMKWPQRSLFHGERKLRRAVTLFPSLICQAQPCHSQEPVSRAKHTASCRIGAGPLRKRWCLFKQLGQNKRSTSFTYAIPSRTKKKKKSQGWGLPWWLSGKESTCQCRRHGFDPWSRKIPRAEEQLSTCTSTASEPVL